MSKLMRFTLVAVVAIVGANLLGVVLRFLSAHALPPSLLVIGNIAMQATSIIIVVTWLIHEAIYQCLYGGIAFAVAPRMPRKMHPIYWVQGVSFAVLAIILIAATFRIATMFTLRWLTSETFERTNFTVSATLALAPLSLLLIPRNLSRQTWKKLSTQWLNMSGLSTLSVGGFGFIGLGLHEQGTEWLRLAMIKSQIRPHLLQAIFVGVVLFWCIASLLCRVGCAVADSEDSNRPKYLFVPTFAIAWLVNVAAFALFLNGTLLTLASHLH